MVEDEITTPKRNSLLLNEAPSFLVKRRNVAESLIDDNSEFSLSLNVSALNQSGLKHSVANAREISFRSCSSIRNEDSASSLLRDVTSTVNFNEISLSGISESGTNASLQSPASRRASGVNPDVNPDTNPDVNPDTSQNANPNTSNINPEDMSYETLLRWEQAQGGVLDEKWKKMRESVLRVLLQPSVET